MAEEDRTSALEDELLQTKRAAITMILSMAEAIANTPEGRAELAKGFEAAAEQSDADPAMVRLSKLVAAALRGTQRH
ncbi:hypothetical protein QCN27_19505 [Cereibacter sp. SYSU M97828]|nr:hypothetical protein [Cereibacter flavus]